MVVWALFDDGNRSYWKAIKKYFPEINVISVGINELNEADYKRIDLSIFNDKLIKQLSKLPTPDIILASPPCESWATTANPIRTYKINSLLLNNFNHYKEQNDKHKLHSKRNFYKQQRTRLLGEATQLGLNLILRTFNPKIWIIENPATSRCWLYQQEFLNWEGIMNKTYYNCYGTNNKKPTIFKSNMILRLKQENKPSTINMNRINGYDLRSVIPELLIKDIIEQCKEQLKTKELENE